MNSLTYLSRQFDVLASARTPPSTPTLENAQLHDDDSDLGALKRVQTWSQKSFLVAEPSGSFSAWSLKRSYSSPAEVNPADPSSAAGPSAPPRVPPPAQQHSSSSRPPSRRPSVTSSEMGRCPPGAAESRMLFVRVLLSLWQYMCAVWRRMTVRMAQQGSLSLPTEDGSDEDEKDTEDEGKDEKAASVRLEQQPPIPPPQLPLPPQALLAEAPAVLAGSGVAPGAGETPRTSTPVSATRKTPLHLPKTLVLDLDETLIHSITRSAYPAASGSGILNRLGLGLGRRDKGARHTVEVVLGGRSTLYHVYKRPFVDYFLRKVSAWYTLVVFTASMQEYADPVIDWLDAGRGILGRRLFRESCTQLPNGSYTKDLSIIEQDLARVCLVDNSPICYSLNEANGIPIEGWMNDPHDEALLDLLPVLDSLRFTSDVRRVLAIRGFS